jgi:hypothetical protein
VSAAALALLAVAGCGGAAAPLQSPAPHTPSHGASSARTATGSASSPRIAARRAFSSHTVATGAFSWLRPQSPPAGWRLARAPDGATLAYPPEWKTVAGDRGSLSAALRDRAGGYIGYLNLTPRQGDERQSNWTTFRIRHNEAEGNRHVRLIAATQNRRFARGAEACVQDAYTTSTGTRYVEVACLLGGRRPSVVVAASPPALWRLLAPTLERAISAAAAGIGAS